MNTLKYWLKRIALAVPAVILLGLSMAPKHWEAVVMPRILDDSGGTIHDRGAYPLDIPPSEDEEDDG